MKITHNDEPYMDIDEAVEHVMRATGKTRRQAKHAIIEMARSGRLRAIGTNSYTNEREAIPPEAWPIVN